MTKLSQQSLNSCLLADAEANRAVRAVPPLWPLAASVAVNPFLGQSREDFVKASARLGRVAGARITMPRRWYREKILSGAITDRDLEEAWASAHPALRPAHFGLLKGHIDRDSPDPAALPTIADLAAAASGIDWPSIVATRIGAWAADYFDEGQALWTAPRGRSAFAAWREFAIHDLSPEILGLKGFARHAQETPDDAPSATARAADRLDLSGAARESCFHRLLMSLGGWAQYARFKLWQAELAGGSDSTATDLLAIRLIWEEALLIQYESQIGEEWARARDAHAAPVTATPDQAVDAILQEAAERAAQRALGEALAPDEAGPAAERPVLQAVFCIDVRSEVMRRALESLDPRIRTHGFAGFFGVAAAHRSFASDVEERRLPVLLNPALQSRAGGSRPAQAERSARCAARAKRAWGRFKLAAVSSFAFVEATGPIHAGKLVADALGLHRRHARPEAAPRFEPDPGAQAKVSIAETILRAMSLTGGFARLVLLVGHGAGVTNNPHASALQCGACGGHSGEVNARLLASLLNDGETRRGLAGRGIVIPDDSLFVGALHDTASDLVTLFEQDHRCGAHAADIELARTRLAAAGAMARGERALKLPCRGNGSSLARRALDWAETRPELGLAGCMGFVAAPRSRTAGRDLAGRVFLHDYDWRQDRDFRVLDLILTAPVVVASWISLQYYGSTVAPSVFGGGNKLLHNVTGGIGVVEGNGGLLRGGLPWQSVHDGENYIHEPLRLSVCIEAPPEAISEVLGRHEEVRALFDNRWMHLFALDHDGRMGWRYSGGLEWVKMAAPAT